MKGQRDIQKALTAKVEIKIKTMVRMVSGCLMWNDGSFGWESEN